MENNELCHYGVLGMRWGVRRYQNEDGSYTVVTDVEISSHDSDAEIAKATTLFVKNENSAFGFNIISSDISAIGYNA